MLSKTDRKICGTCEYWTGHRNPTFTQNSIPKINIVDDNGLCMNIYSRFDGKSRNKQSYCKNYSKWTEIL